MNERHLERADGPWFLLTVLSVTFDRCERRMQQLHLMQADGEYNGWDMLMPQEREFRCPVCRRLATSAIIPAHLNLRRLSQFVRLRRMSHALA